MEPLLQPNQPTILVADDQPHILEALRLLLKSAEMAVLTAHSPDEVLKIAAARDLDGVLVDLNYTRDTTSGIEGMDLLRSLRELDGTLPIVTMTAWGSVEGAVEAMRRGAGDYVEKPWDNDRLVATLRTQVQLGRARRLGRRLADAERRRELGSTVDFVAGSAAMQPVLELVGSVAPSDANVLITGEHGTGKEVVARRLHAMSKRAGQALVTVNAGGFSDGVFESELFGHVRGAFTDARNDRAGCFELAHEGTLFLDEIANVPWTQQGKLLRALENREIQRVGSTKVRRVDVRVVSATNADIVGAVAKREFREDLLYRLNTVEIHLPPLRERTEDIAELAAGFLAREAAHYGRSLDGFSDKAMQALVRHPWPGNVRELHHAVERAVLVAAGGVVSEADLSLVSPEGEANLRVMTLAQAECVLVQRAMKRHGDNVTRAARDLGISRAALYRKIERCGL